MSATKAQIRSIEKVVGHPLPEDYQTILMDYPEPMSTAKFAGTPISESYFYRKPNQIIAANKRVRTADFVFEDNQGRQKKWPDHYAIVGENGLGDYYVLNLKNGRIFEWMGDDGRFKQYAKNIRRFVYRIFQELAILSCVELEWDD